MNINQVLQFSDGDPAQIQGAVTKAFAAEERQGGRNGSFWTQGVVVADSTGEMKCSVAANQSPGIVLGENVTIKGSVNKYVGKNGPGISLKGNLVARQQPQGQQGQQPQGQQHAPQSPQQGNQQTGDVGGQIMRQNALGHATALVVADKVGMDELFSYAVKFAAFSATGATPGNHQKAQQAQPEEDTYGGGDDIPF